jgi:nucleoside-diphosphate-sugar epimerase
MNEPCTLWRENMNVFLTGATGYIGSTIATALQRAGHGVTGLAHSDEDVPILEERGMRALRGDLYDGASLAQGVRSADGVIHAANTGRPDMALAEQAAISAILCALEGTSKPFLYTQGRRDYGDTPGVVITEESPFRPIGFFAWRPVLAQRILQAATRGVRTVVISPGIVYGHAGGVPAGFVQSAKKGGAARYIGTGDNHWTMVHVEDLADLYVRALEQASAGSTFIAAADPPFLVRDIAAAASRGAGAGGKTEAWPVDQARQSLGPSVDALILDQRLSGERARRVLGWTPQGPSVLEDLEHGSYTR